jgi:hypothetical protein
MAQLDTMKLVKVVKVTRYGGNRRRRRHGRRAAARQPARRLGNSTPNGVGLRHPVVPARRRKERGHLRPGRRRHRICRLLRPGHFERQDLEEGAGETRAPTGSTTSPTASTSAESSPRTPEQYVRFTEDTIEIHDKTGNVVKLSSAGIELTPNGVLPVTVNGNLVVTGNLLLGGKFLAQAGTRYAGNFSTTGDVIAGTMPSRRTRTRRRRTATATPNNRRARRSRRCKRSFSIKRLGTSSSTRGATSRSRRIRTRSRRMRPRQSGRFRASASGTRSSACRTSRRSSAATSRSRS